MCARTACPCAYQEHFTAYIEKLARAIAHADRHAPLRNYCIGLLLPGGRKSIERLAARLSPGDVRRTHQSLHHLVADSPWDDDRLLAEVRACVLPAMTAQHAVVAWVVTNVVFSKQGSHSVGVERQVVAYPPKPQNCQIAVSLAVATEQASLPIALRLYLPESWAHDFERRRRAGVPETVVYQTTVQLALSQIRRALADGVPQGVVLADAHYGGSSEFRAQLAHLGLHYVVEIHLSTPVWAPESPHLSNPSSPLRQAPGHMPLPLLPAWRFAERLPKRAWRKVSWRQEKRRKRRSRFAAVRVCPGAQDPFQARPEPEQWLLIEWPQEAPTPTQCWLSTLPPETALARLVQLAKHTWVVARDVDELRSDLGLEHFEGRNWRGFHHHATLCIAAFGFLVMQRSLWGPSFNRQHLVLSILGTLSAGRSTGTGSSGYGSVNNV